MKEFSTQQQNLIDKLTKVDNLSDRIQSLYTKTNKNLEEIKSVESAIDKIIKEKTQGFPWLADAISQYFEFRDLKIAEFLQNKLRPAISSAERVKELAREKREFQKNSLLQEIL